MDISEMRVLTQFLKWVVITGIPYYMLIGLAFIVFLILIEATNMALRSGYREYLNKELPSNDDPSNLFTYLKTIIFWPYMFKIML